MTKELMRQLSDGTIPPGLNSGEELEPFRRGLFSSVDLEKFFKNYKKFSIQRKLAIHFFYLFFKSDKSYKYLCIMYYL